MLLEKGKSIILKHIWKNENMKKKTITENLINDELEPSLSDESEKESNNESDNEPKKAF